MNETMEAPAVNWPAIDPEPVHTDVAVAAAGAVDLARVDIHAVVRAQFAAGRTEAEAALKELGSVVLDLSNQSKITEAKSLRERRVNVPIADMRKLGKVQRSALDQAGKTSTAEEKEVVGIFAKAGEALTTQIDAAQKKIDAEKEAKRQAEEKRLQGLRDQVDVIMANWLGKCSAEGMTADRISKGIELLQALPMPADAADVKAYWLGQVAVTTLAMEKLRDAAQRREEAAALEAQRLENERIATEQAEKQRQIDEQLRRLEELENQRLAEQESEAARQRAITPAAPVATAAATQGTADTPEPEQLEAAPTTEQEAELCRRNPAPHAAQPLGSTTPTITVRIGSSPVIHREPAAMAIIDEQHTPRVDVAAAADIEDRCYDGLGPEDQSDDEGGIDAKPISDAVRDRMLNLDVLLQQPRQSKFPHAPKDLPGAWWKTLYAEWDALKAATGRHPA